LGLGFWSVPLFDQDEGIYAEATREMLARGDYLTPFVNGAPFFEKPILMYWAEAGCARLFGLNEFAMRLPSVLASILWIAATVAFLRRRRDPGVAYLAGFLLATTLMTPVIGKAAITDPLLNLFLTLTMFCGYEATRAASDRDRRRSIRLTYIFTALGFLAKGPIAVVVPLGVSFLWLLRMRRLREWPRLVCDPGGLILFILLALPWYGWELHVYGRSFWTGFFVQHNIGRFRTPLEGHAGMLLYYVPVILVGVLPHTGLLIQALRDVRRWFREDFTAYCALWLLFTVGFFSLSATKLPHYASCAFVPLALLLAESAGRRRKPGWVVLPALLGLLVCLLIPHMIVTILPRVRNGEIRDMLASSTSAFPRSYDILCLIAVAAVGVLLLLRRLAAGWRFVGGSLLFILVVNALVIPAYGRLTQEPIRQAGRYARTHDLDVTTWRVNNPSFMFYARRVAPKGEPAPGGVVLTYRSAAAGLSGAEVLFEENNITLVRVSGANLR
jgi:4-amino-4-deoxy-L-arabinose transferase-like glycosyltransferase